MTSSYGNWDGLPSHTRFRLNLKFLESVVWRSYVEQSSIWALSESELLKLHRQGPRISLDVGLRHGDPQFS